MIEIPNKESIEKFIESVENEDAKNLLKNKCKFLFMENSVLHFVMYAEESEKEILRKSWGSIKTKALTILNVTKLKPIQESEEKALFLEKALEIFKAKEVKISLA